MIEADLIFDIGCHHGDDTDFYLRKGFRVVAVDADKSLCDQVSSRFPAAIAAGRLTVVYGLISESERDSAAFYIFETFRDWNTADAYFKTRGEREGHVATEVVVPIVSTEKLFEAFGIPYYMKVDIEGRDIVPLRALERVPERPAFVSIEVAHHDPSLGFSQLLQLTRCGYTKFQFFNQCLRQHVKAPTPPREGTYAEFFPAQSTTGLFGRELDGRWLNFTQAASRLTKLCEIHASFRDDPRYSKNGQFGGTLRSKIYNRFRRHVLGDPVAWYDLHATR
jgi:FkbM family methyltransferase